MAEITGKPNFSILPVYQYFAMTRKYRGIPYARIVEEILEKYDVEVSESTIKYWFYKNGPLKTCYEEFAAQETEFEIELTHSLLKSYLSPAARTLGLGLAGQANAIQIAAAKEILERGIGKVKDEMDLRHSGTVGVAMLDVLQALKEVKKENYATDAGANQNNNQGAG
ncbi:MAG: hypothetical protein KKB38_20590 [Gammaproteobacteria bacterium]|nr:hypothetical protein [Gammaproteobacteria bacterium]